MLAHTRHRLAAVVASRAAAAVERARAADALAAADGLRSEAAALRGEVDALRRSLAEAGAHGLQTPQEARREERAEQLSSGSTVSSLPFPRASVATYSLRLPPPLHSTYPPPASAFPACDILPIFVCSFCLHLLCASAGDTERVARLEADLLRARAQRDDAVRRAQRLEAEAAALTAELTEAHAFEAAALRTALPITTEGMAMRSGTTSVGGAGTKADKPASGATAGMTPAVASETILTSTADTAASCVSAGGEACITDGDQALWAELEALDGGACIAPPAAAGMTVTTVGTPQEGTSDSSGGAGNAVSEEAGRGAAMATTTAAATSAAAKIGGRAERMVAIEAQLAYGLLPSLLPSDCAHVNRRRVAGKAGRTVSSPQPH